MACFPDAPRRMLSQSFRFGQRIADVANSILAGLDEPTDLILRGLEGKPSRVITQQGEPYPNPKCVLTRTNAAAVSAVMAAQAEGRSTHLIASVDEIAAFVRAARDLQNGRSTSHPELGCFSAWPEVVEHSKTDEGQDLRLWVRMIDEFGTEVILRALDAQVPERDADLVVCTAHKSKGREWESVRLAGDFPPAAHMSDADRRLLYVAATRAQLVLDLSGCPPFHAFRDRETGEETPGLRIAWTGPMPTANEAECAYAETAEEIVGVAPETAANGEAASNPPSAEKAPQTHANSRQTASGGNGAPADGEFTWANYEGKWRIGGPSGRSGQTVTVVRRNGSRTTERLGRVVKDFRDRCIYEKD